VFDYKDPAVSKKIKDVSNGSIKVCLDGISEYGSTKLAADAMSEGGKIITLCKSADRKFFEPNMTRMPSEREG
jgi:hypothetical protein